MTTGLNLLSKIVAEADLEKFLRMHLVPEFFDGDERQAFAFVEDHVRRFGAIPKGSTLKRETGIELPEAQEAADYYLRDLERRHLHRELVKGLEVARDHLKDRQPEAALARVSETAVRLTTTEHRREILDFRQALEPIMREFRTKVALGSQHGIRLGWETLDDMTGGLGGGDTVCVVGRPATGKTYLLTWAARNVWWNQHKTPLLLTMEMNALPLIQRIAAIHSQVNVKQIRDAALSTNNLTKMKGVLMEAADYEVPFWIVDGDMAATVDDLIMLARQYKPDVVFVDGGYLMGHRNESLSLWQKVKENVESLHKQIAKAMDIPVVISYQFNRQAAQLRNGQGAGLEHIGLSDAVGQVSSLVLGLFEDENVETLARRRVDILKGREGATGDFYINWNFNKMDFSEHKDDELGALQFLTGTVGAGDP